MVESVVIDGVASIGAHNGVFRIACFRLGADGKPLPSIELLVPSGAARGFAESFSKLRG